jgi:glutamate--cysteine ligase catalytic subunit
MGILTVGTPMKWEDSKKYLQYVRRHGILQFLHTWNRVKDIADDKLRWGDEVECAILNIDPETKKVRLACRGADIRDNLNEIEVQMDHLTEGCTWHPEYGAWMVSSCYFVVSIC